MTRWSGAVSRGVTISEWNCSLPLALSFSSAIVSSKAACTCFNASVGGCSCLRSFGECVQYSTVLVRRTVCHGYEPSYSTAWFPRGEKWIWAVGVGIAHRQCHRHCLFIFYFSPPMLEEYYTIVDASFVLTRCGSVIRHMTHIWMSRGKRRLVLGFGYR